MVYIIHEDKTIIHVLFKKGWEKASEKAQQLRAVAGVYSRGLSFISQHLLGSSQLCVIPGN